MDLRHAGRLLPRRRRDLRRRLCRLAQGLRQRSNRLTRLPRHASRRRHALGHLFRRQHRRARPFLNLAENLPHLRRRLFGLIGQGLDLAGHHREALAVFARSTRLNGGVKG